jgi:NAD(P)-dependent dehydrogenase (short-subunit alcohol dehydrogenase family)
MTSSFVREPAVTGDAYARDLLGARAVVTGGTRGIGAAIAGTLARRGARVLVSARNQAADLPEGVRIVVADAATIEGAGRLAAEAEQVLGEVDVLVNNAGGVMPVPGGIGAIGDEDWQAVIAANLLSAVRLDRLLIPGRSLITARRRPRSSITRRRWRWRWRWRRTGCGSTRSRPG